jgi:hypothetical protein
MKYQVDRTKVRQRAELNQYKVPAVSLLLFFFFVSFSSWASKKKK